MKGRISGSVLAVIMFSIPLLASAQQRQPGEDSGRPQMQSDKHPGERGSHPPPPPRRDAAFFLGQAMLAIDDKATLLIDQGKVADAIEALREVYSMDIPKENPFFEMKVRLIGRLAVAYADTGQKEEALKTIKRLLKDVPPDTPAEALAWLLAGSAYKKAGMPDEALEAFDHSAEISKELAKTGWPPRRPPSDTSRGPCAGP